MLNSFQHPCACREQIPKQVRNDIFSHEDWFPTDEGGVPTHEDWSPTDEGNAPTQQDCFSSSGDSGTIDEDSATSLED